MYACSRFHGARMETLKLNFDYWTLLLLLVTTERHWFTSLSITICSYAHMHTHTHTHSLSYLLTYDDAAIYILHVYVCTRNTGKPYLHLSVSIFLSRYFCVCSFLLGIQVIDKGDKQISFQQFQFFAFHMASNDVRIGWLKKNTQQLTTHMWNTNSLKRQNEMSVCEWFNTRVHVFACVFKQQ